MDNIFLSEVITTRISHDIIGNIGAVANAMELLNDSESEDDNSDVFNILDYSSQVLTKRMKFFRLCFGLANSSLKLEEMKKITEDYFSTLGHPKNPTEIVLNINSPEAYKLVLPTAMMMADTISKTGKIEVRQTEHSLIISAISSASLDMDKLHNIDLILQGQKAEDNQSIYAPLYYLMSYLEGSDIPVKRVDNTLIIGD